MVKTPQKALKPATKPRTESSGEDKYFSRAVAKALNLLEILRDSKGPLSLNQLTLQVGMMKSSVFRLLYTLEKEGYVNKNSDGKYLLLQATRSIVPNPSGNKLLQAAFPAMKELSREFGETVTLAQLFDNHIQVVAVIESPQLIRMANVVGRILQPHASSLGKTIVAFQPEEIGDKLLRSYGIYSYTPHTITDETELKAEFEKIRSLGYGVDREESILEGCCFGAPIFDSERNATAAISISVPNMRLKSEEDEIRMISALKAKTESITRQLSG